MMVATAASPARIDVWQTRGPDSLSRAIVLLMSGVEPRNSGRTKRQDHETTKPRNHEKEVWFFSWFVGISRFVFSCVVWSCLIAAVGRADAPAPLRVESLDGAAVDPFDARPGTKAIVFLLTSTDCPISSRYAPEVRRLVEKFSPKGVIFRLVYPNPADKRVAIVEHMNAFAYAGATDALRDPTHALVKHTGVTVTPEVAVYAGGR